MRYLLISLVSLVFVFLSAGCTPSAKQPALHDFGLTGSASIHEGNPGVIARDGVYTAGPQGGGAVIARDPVYAARQSGAGGDAADPKRVGVVATVGAPSWLWDNRIRYRLLHVEPTHVRFYGLDMWIAPPPELFEQMLVFQLKTLNYFLNVQLLEFEQQFDASDRARVVLHFTVDAYSADHKQKIATQEFQLEQATRTPDAAGAVGSFTDLTKKATVRIQDWLAGLS